MFNLSLELTFDNAVIQAQHSANAHGKPYFITANKSGHAKVVPADEFNHQYGQILRVVWPVKRP